jgi:hypothetical protein
MRQGDSGSPAEGGLGWPKSAVDQEPLRGGLIPPATTEGRKKHTGSSNSTSTRWLLRKSRYVES